jgi:hypothetical protein
MIEVGVLSRQRKCLNAKTVERRRRKGFKSLYELNYIKNIHPDLILLIKPYLKVSSVENKSEGPLSDQSKLKLNIRSRVIKDLQNRKGFINNKYAGSNYKYYNRLKAAYGKYKLGFITEKDAGEKSLYDHYAGYFEYKSNGILNNIIIGDYNFEFGQGLVLWSPYSFSKGTESVNTPSRRERFITPSISSEENKFFRGSAVSLNFNSLIINGFYSKHKIDGSIDPINDFSSLYQSGYHRTDSEILKKNKVVENAYGVSIVYKYADVLSLGLLHFRNQFSHPIKNLSNNSLAENRFSSSSLGYKLYLGNAALTGEISLSNDEYAYIANLYLGLTKNLKFLASFRNYPPFYYSMYASGFGENGNTQNELGYYFGVKITTDYGRLNYYFDQFKSPSQSFYCDFPSSGTDHLFAYEVDVLRNIKLLCKFKTENKEVQRINNDSEKIVVRGKSNYRIELKYKMDKSLSGKTRFELVNYSLDGNFESGLLTYQELKYRVTKLLSVTMRIIFFKTDSYNSRIYEFENDLNGIMSNPPMYGEGYRWYLMLNYRFFNSFILGLKYSETYKPHLKSLGSGNSEIPGNLDNRLNVQLDYIF